MYVEACVGNSDEVPILLIVVIEPTMLMGISDQQVSIVREADVVGRKGS